METIRKEHPLRVPLPYHDIKLTNTTLFLKEYIRGITYNVTLPNPCVELSQENTRPTVTIALMKCFPAINSFTTYMLYAMQPLFSISNLKYIEDFMTYIRVQGSR